MGTPKIMTQLKHFYRLKKFSQVVLNARNFIFLQHFLKKHFSNNVFYDPYNFHWIDLV